MRTYSSQLVILAGIAATVMMGCTGDRMIQAYSPETGGDPRRGEHLIVQYGCGSCHTIPGIRSARGVVGPPLMFFSRRTYIAGELPNTPDNVERWIMSPQSVEPKTAMPALGISEPDARDIAAYLYTLR